MRREGAKSFADDLVLGRGVVTSRAAASLRSVETQPQTRRFVRGKDGRISEGLGFSRSTGEVSAHGGLLDFEKN